MKETILISIIIILAYIFFVVNRNNLVYVEDNSGKRFMVQKDNDKKTKGELLGEIINRMYILKNHLIKYKDDPEFGKYWEQLDENFNQNRTVIYETDPKSDLTSFSVNKGEELSVCLRSKKTGQLHEINLLMYVVIHEMAHFACPEIGHGDLFKKIFKKMTEEAINLNLYSLVDYSQNPVEYCGMTLSSSII